MNEDETWEGFDERLDGWIAIEATLKSLYPGQEPAHFGTLQRYSEGGPDPLDGTSAYWVDSPPHRHYVSYGLTELYGKDSDNPTESGYGFELTFRLAIDTRDAKPPTWPLAFLQTLARYVFNTGEVFGHGHYIEMGGPIVNGHPTDLTALVFSRDPQLPQVDSPNGRFEFIQAVGITDREYKWIQANNPDDFIAEYRRVDPLMITVLKRPSLV